MSNPVSITLDMMEAREELRRLLGEEKYARVVGKLVDTLKTVAAALDADPFQLAVKESISAGKMLRPVAAWQMVSAACEIAEDEAVDQ